MAKGNFKDLEVNLQTENGSHIVIECPLCGAKGLHIIGTPTSEETRQCLNCGYVTAPKFKLNGASRETVDMHLTEEMKKWAVEKDNYLWIPTIMTLPFGMLYPYSDSSKKMQWGYSEMVEIPKEEQHLYPAPKESESEFYEHRYDTENQIQFDSFLEGMSYVNNKVKELKEQANAQREQESKENKSS